METIVFLLLSVAIFYKLFRSFGNEEYSDPVYASETVPEQPSTQEDLPVHIMETIKNIRKADPYFSVESFLLGASKAIYNIYTAAYSGNLQKYKEYIEEEPLLLLNKITPQKKFQCELGPMEITAAELSDSTAYLTVKISVTFFASDKYPKEEYWTFKRNLHNSDKNWVLLNIR